MRARENRLTGLEIDAKRTDSAAVQQRIRLQATVKVYAAIRAGLVQSGIDPANAKALHHGEAEAAELASLGEKPSLPGDGEQFEASGGGGLADVFFAKIGDMAGRYRDWSTPDFTRASPAELFAWCLARPAPPP
jgi:hypothetical protein